MLTQSSPREARFEAACIWLDPQVIVRAAPGEPADEDGFTLITQSEVELARRRHALSRAWRVGFGGLLVLLLTALLAAARSIAEVVTHFVARPAARVRGRQLVAVTLSPRLLQSPHFARG